MYVFTTWYIVYSLIFKMSKYIFLLAYNQALNVAMF